MAVTHQLTGKSFQKVGAIKYGPYKGLDMWRLYLSGRFDCEAGDDFAEAPEEWNVTIEKDGLIWGVDLAIREELGTTDTSTGYGLMFVNKNGQSYAMCFTKHAEEVVGAAGGMKRNSGWAAMYENDVQVPIEEGDELGGTMSYYHAAKTTAYWIGYNIRIFLMLK